MLRVSPGRMFFIKRFALWIELNSPVLRTCSLGFASNLLEMEILLFGRNFPPLCRGKVFNRNLTRNSVAVAKTPSVFPCSPKFFLISQNPRNSEKCRVASFFEASDFGGEKTSFNPSVIFNYYSDFLHRKVFIIL